MPTWGNVADIMMALAIMASAYLSWRNGRAIEQVHKSTNSMHDQIVKMTRAEGITEGRALEAATALTAESPLPVTDDRTAKAAERTAAAAEVSAKATERVADAAEVVSKKSS